MALTLMYITNNPEVALIAEKYGVDRIWIDLEVIGKKERQNGMNTVKSNHTINDIKKIKPLLTKSKMLVRINPWNDKSEEEINEVINAGADMIMLPMWKTSNEVNQFIHAVKNRCKSILLLETREAVDCIDEVLINGKFDEIHIGINDLHLSYGLTFMFELLSNGTIEMLCNKFKKAGIPYGFGGIARLGAGDLPAEKIVIEHYRMGSTRAILSRSFCNTDILKDIKQIEDSFQNNIRELRDFEKKINPNLYEENKKTIDESIENIVALIKEK